MSKFNPGDRVFLFNAQVPAIESYDVYAVLRMPVTVKGKYQEDSLGIAGNLEAGNTEVHDQYQLVPNRIVDEAVIFGSEAECREWYRNWFNE